MSSTSRRRLRAASADQVRRSGGPVSGRRACGAGLATAITAGLVLGTAPAALADLPSGGAVAWGFGALGQTAVPDEARDGVVQIAAGYNHNIALRTDGSVVGWGGGSDLAVPEHESPIARIAAGGNHDLALTADGEVLAWGQNDRGQTDVPVAAQSGVVGIAGGFNHSLALKNGQVIAWGYAPVVPDDLTGIDAIAAGQMHDLALIDGEVVSWGGQTSVPAGAQSDVVAISAFFNNNLALKGDGTVVAWGDSYAGLDEVPADLTEVTVAGDEVVAVAAGQYLSLALKADGTIVAWGEDSEGALDVPVGAQPATAIAAGMSHGVALVEAADVAPAFTAGNPSGSATVGEAYSYQFTATGTPAPAFSLTPGSELPQGMSLDGSGLLSGDPQETGEFAFSVQASNGVGDPAVSGPHTLTVSEAPALTSAAPPATGLVGQSFTHTFTATGTPEPTLGLDGDLPAGLEFDDETGELSGTPTESGAFNYLVTASNGIGDDASAEHTLTVNAGTALVADAPPATAPIGVEYTYTFTATGFPLPTFTVDGDLPEGLEFDDETGVLSGTPTQTGTSTFTVSASNGVGDPAVGASHTVSVTAAPMLTADDPEAVTPLGAPFSYTFAALGFPQPTWALAEGSDLPAGLTLDAATGTLAGTPTEAGTFNYGVVARNSAGPDAVGTSHSLYVTAESVFTADNPPAAATVGTAYTYGFAATGSPAPQFVHSGNLPAGLTLDPHSGVLSGTPTTAGTYTFRVSALTFITEGTTGAEHTITVTARPAAATAVVATGGAGQVDVSWTAPVGGGPVATYVVTSTPGNASCETTGLSCVLGGMAGETYQVTVTPVGPTGLLGSAATATSTAVTGPPVADAPPADAPTTLTTTDGKLTTVAPNQEITVVGTGFLPYSTANIVIYSTPQVLASVQTDALGNFTKTVTIPGNLAAGQHTLVASGVDENGVAYSITMPVSVPAGAPSPVATAPTAGNGDGLAFTGSAPVVPIAIAGLVLIAAGALTVVAARRRRA